MLSQMVLTYLPTYRPTLLCQPGTVARVEIPALPIGTRLTQGHPATDLSFFC